MIRWLTTTLLPYKLSHVPTNAAFPYTLEIFPDAAEGKIVVLGKTPDDCCRKAAERINEAKA